MTKIEINECVYYVHPVYNLYAGSEDGKIIHIITKVSNIKYKTRNGYLQVSVKKYRGRQKIYYIHRFIWKCFNGVIPEGKVIDHINNNKEDNRLCNLQLIAQQENCKKSAKKRDYSFVSQNHNNRKCVKATNKNTNEVIYFNSLYATQQYLSINVGIVKMVCENSNNYKSGVSKKDGHSHTFEYIKEDDLPTYHKKSANIKPKRVSEEDKKKNHSKSMKKWQQKSMIV